MLDRSLNVKVCDFGLARFKADLNTGTQQFSGTPTYMAPELFSKTSYSEKVDTFAFGTLLWELLARDIPFNGWDTPDIKEKVLAGESLGKPAGASAKLCQLVEDCRDPDPKKRPDFSYVRGVLESV